MTPHGYSELNGQVTITMTKGDFDYLMIMLGYAAGACLDDKDNDVVGVNKIFSLIDRLNEGNPNFTPYNL